MSNFFLLRKEISKYLMQNKTPHDGARAAPAEPAEGLPNRFLELQLNEAFYGFG